MTSKELNDGRRSALDLFRHEHPSKETDRLVLDNCAACALEGRGAMDDGPNFSGWHLIYVQAQRRIPAQWADAFHRFLSGPPGLYRNNVQRWIRALGMPGVEPVISCPRGCGPMRLCKVPRLGEAKCEKCGDVAEVIPSSRTCGACLAGICVMNGSEIQRCDDCELFDTDEDAAGYVDALLKVLAAEYEHGGSVADALGRVVQERT